MISYFFAKALIAVSTTYGAGDTSENRKQAGGVIPTLPKDMTSELGRFVATHLHLTDRFETARQDWTNSGSSELTSDNFHIERFLGSGEQLTIDQLNEALAGCVPANRMDANHVSITIHYSCAKRMRARLVYNFQNERIERVLVGDLPVKLKCGICVDEAKN